MDETLAYLKESLSNWADDNPAAHDLYQKLQGYMGESEAHFASDLSQEEVQFLSEIMNKEISYAEHANDDVRLAQLNEVNEQLY